MAVRHSEDSAFDSHELCGQIPADRRGGDVTLKGNVILRDTEEY
jgi:hypothetical protein